MKKHNSLLAYGALSAALTLLLVFVCFLTLACNEGDGFEPVPQISLDKDNLNLTMGGGAQEIIITVVKSSRIKDVYRLEWESTETVAKVTAKDPEPDDETITDNWANISKSTIITLNVEPIAARETTIIFKFYNVNGENDEENNRICTVNVSS